MAYTKGQIITLDGKEYRIIKLNGSVAEVVGMTNASDSQQFAASGQIYAGSALDTYLNSTFYATLSDKLKAAIVDKTFTQDSWYWNNLGDPDYSGYYGTTNPGTSAYTISLGNAAFGSSITRHVYALSVQDVLDYILDTSVTDGQLQNYNIWKMFWNDEVQHTGSTNYLWLRSASASSSSDAFRVSGNDGYVSSRSVSYNYAVRPAFQIDLDVYFSLWADENFKTVVFKSNAGTDAQNAQLIGYLSENADPSAVTTFDLTSLGLSAGDHTIKVKATATGYADSDFSNSVTYSAYEQLATPVCSISDDTLSWAAISNAASYTLYVDSVSTQTGLTGTSFDLSTLSLAEGTYSIQLQAIGSGYYTDSELSTAVEYQVSAPSSNTKLFVAGTLAGNLVIRIGEVDAQNPQYYNDVAYGGTSHLYASWIYNPPIDGTDIPWQIGASGIGSIAFRYTSNTQNEFVYNVNAQDITGTPNVQASISFYDENNNLIITNTSDQFGYVKTPTSAQGGTLKMHMIINLEITG